MNHRALLAVTLLSIGILACGSGDDVGPSNGGSTAASTGDESTSTGDQSTSASTSSGQPVTCTDSTKESGDGTDYDADGSGNCSFDPSPEDLMVGAMNHTDYAASAVCGECVAITGPKGNVTVRIVDQCPECKPGDIDLSPDAFAKLDDLSAGRIDISWTVVPCDVSGPIQYHFKDGSNEYWTAVQIRNSTNAILKVEAKVNGSYQSLGRVDYNYFIADSGLGKGPYDLRVTDVYGNTLEDSVQFAADTSFPGTAQFPACK